MRFAAAAVTLLVLAALSVLRAMAACPMPEEPLSLAAAPLPEIGLTELQQNGDALPWICSGVASLIGLALLVRAVPETCRSCRRHRES